MIHVTGSQSDDIIAVINGNSILDDNHKKTLKDSLETYEFICFLDDKGGRYLEKRNRLIIPNEDNGYTEFIINESVKYRDGHELVAEVYAYASYLDLKKSRVIKPNQLNEFTVEQATSWAVDGTEWKVGTIESNNYRTFNITSNTNPFAFLRTIANEFDLELNFRVETNGRKVIGRYVDLLEKVGEWRGREIEFGKDLLGVKRRENTENVYTALIGIGPENEDGERLEVFVEDEDALQRWGRPNEVGRLQHLIDFYEPNSERSDMTLQELTQYTTTELNKRINEVVDYEINVADLENVPFMQNKKIRFGDTLRIKDVKFNPPLYVEARVHTLERSIKDKSQKKIVLGDYVEFTEEEINAIWKQLQDEIRKKLDASDIFDYTYDKETIDNKDEITYEEGKEFAEAVGSEAKGHADIVAGEAENSAKEYAEDRSAEALQSAMAYAVAEELYNQKMQEIALELEGKVEYEYIDGQLELKVDSSVTDAIQNTVNDLVNTRAEMIQDIIDLESDLGSQIDDLVSTRADLIQDIIDLESDVEKKLDVSIYNQKILDIESDIAGKVNGEWVDGRLSSKADADSVYTISEVDNRLNNYVGLTVYNTDKDGYVERFESAESRITQNETEIATTVKQTDFEALENEVGGYGGRLTEAESSIIQNANAIESKVSQTDFNSLTGRVSSAESSITQQAGLIEQRVTKTEYTKDIDGIVSDISSNESRITQTESEIASTVKRTEFETLEDELGNIGTRMENAESSISQNATSISQRVLQTDFNSLTGRVSTAESSITTMAGQISLKASQSDLDTVTGDLSTLSGEISTMAGEISLKAERSVVEGLRTDFDNLEIGGRNLIVFTEGFASHTPYNSMPVIKSEHSIETEINTTGTLNLTIRSHSFRDIQKPNTRYTISGFMYVNSEPISQGFFTTFNTYSSMVQEKLTIQDNGYFEVVFVTGDNPYAYLFHNTVNATIGDILKIEYFKVEKGNKATDWTPAPEDIEAQFDSVTSDISELVVDVNGISGTVSSINQKVGEHGTDISSLNSQLNIQAGLIEGKVESTTYTRDIDGILQDIESANTAISQNASAITLRATKTEFDNLTGRVDSAESSITTMAGQISLKAERSVVEGLQTDFDNLEIGGRNLLLDSGKVRNSTRTVIVNTYESLRDYVGEDVVVSFDLMINEDGVLRNIYSSYPYQNNGISIQAGIHARPTEKGVWQRFTIKTYVRDWGNNNVNWTSGAIAFHDQAGNNSYKLRNIKIEKGNKATDWTPAPEDIEAQFDSVTSDISELVVDVDGISGTVSSLSQTVGTHGTNITNLTSQLNIQAGLIEGKVDSTTYETGINGVINSISSHNTRITQNTNAINLRATKTEVDNLAGEVSSNTAQLSVQAGLIESKVEQTEFDGLEVGGMNLARGLGGDVYESNRFYASDFNSVELVTLGDKVWVKVDSGLSTLRLYRITIEPNTEYTWSFDAFVEGGTRTISITPYYAGSYGRGNYTVDSVPRRISHTFKSLVNASYDILHIGNPANVHFANFQLQKGNKATDWSPAPEDFQNEIDGIQGTISNHETSISQNASAITQRATKTEVNTLSGRVSTAESSITTMAGQISSKVSETDYTGNKIASLINQTATTIDIQASKINLRGAVTVLSDITGELGNVTSGSFTAYDNNDELEYAYIGSGMIEVFSWETGNHTILQRGKFTSKYIGTESRSMEISQNEIKATPELVINSPSIRFSGGNVIEFPNGPSVDMAGGIARFRADARTYLMADGGNSRISMFLNGNSSFMFETRDSLNHSFLRAGQVGMKFLNSSAQQVQIRNSSDSAYANLSAKDITATNDVNVTNDVNAGNRVNASELRDRGGTMRFVGGGSYTYVQTSGSEVRATKFASTTLVPMRASSHPTASSILTKTNIEEFNMDEAYFLLDNADIFKYHTKSNVEQGIYDKAKIGMITEAIPSLLRDENGIDPYSIVSTLWKVVKNEKELRLENEKKIDDLQLVILELINENEILKEKI